MKTNIIFKAILGISLLAFAGCQSDKQAGETGKDDVVTVTIGATGDETEGTRAGIIKEGSDYRLFWVPGDTIGAFFVIPNMAWSQYDNYNMRLLSTTTATSGSDETTFVGYFSAMRNGAEGTMYAYSPHLVGITPSLTPENDMKSVPVTVSASQIMNGKYFALDSHVLLAKPADVKMGNKDGYSKADVNVKMRFKTQNSFINVKANIDAALHQPGTQKIKSLTVTFPEGVNVAGTATMDITNTTGAYTFSDPSEVKNIIKVTPATSSDMTYSNMDMWLCTWPAAPTGTTGAITFELEFANGLKYTKTTAPTTFKLEKANVYEWTVNFDADNTDVFVPLPAARFERVSAVSEIEEGYEYLFSSPYDNGSSNSPGDLVFNWNMALPKEGDKYVYTSSSLVAIHTYKESTTTPAEILNDYFTETPAGPALLTQSKFSIKASTAQTGCFSFYVPEHFYYRGDLKYIGVADSNTFQLSASNIDKDAAAWYIELDPNSTADNPTFFVSPYTHKNAGKDTVLGYSKVAGPAPFDTLKRYWLMSKSQIDGADKYPIIIYKRNRIAD